MSYSKSSTNLFSTLLSPSPFHFLNLLLLNRNSFLWTLPLITISSLTSSYTNSLKEYAIFAVYIASFPLTLHLTTVYLRFCIKRQKRTNICQFFFFFSFLTYWIVSILTPSETLESEKLHLPDSFAARVLYANKLLPINTFPKFWKTHMEQRHSSVVISFNKQAHEMKTCVSRSRRQWWPDSVSGYHLYGWQESFNGDRGSGFLTPNTWSLNSICDDKHWN